MERIQCLSGQQEAERGSDGDEHSVVDSVHIKTNRLINPLVPSLVLQSFCNL